MLLRGYTAEKRKINLNNLPKKLYKSVDKKYTYSQENDELYDEDLNVLMIKVLIDEIKKMICKKDDFGVISNCTYFTSLEEGGKC